MTLGYETGRPPEKVGINNYHYNFKSYKRIHGYVPGKQSENSPYNI